MRDGNDAMDVDACANAVAAGEPSSVIVARTAASRGAAEGASQARSQRDGHGSRMRGEGGKLGAACSVQGRVTVGERASQVRALSS